MRLPDVKGRVESEYGIENQFKHRKNVKKIQGTLKVCGFKWL